jgi:prephenate dehydrogenase
MKVVIAGLGLIGGSIGMALRRRGWSVAFVDPAVSEGAARDAGAADEKLDHARGDLVVVAAPVDAALRMRVDAPVVTTTCSVMAPFRHWIAGHPFAGSEKNGLGAARAELFAGRPWFVIRDEPAVRKMIDAAGAQQVVIDAEEHDRAMALTSHLPQVISTALASLIEQKQIDPLFIGTGVRALLRLAGSSYDVWGSVLEANQENVSQAADELLRVIRGLDAGDFERAKRAFGAPPER